MPRDFFVKGRLNQTLGYGLSGTVFVHMYGTALIEFPPPFCLFGMIRSEPPGDKASRPPWPVGKGTRGQAEREREEKR